MKFYIISLSQLLLCLSLFAEPKMINIKANPDFSFAKGLSKNESGESSPIKKDYFIGAYPITNAEYKEFLKENKSVKAPSYWKNSDFPKGKEKHPVLGVSYENALKYCEWLSKKNKKLKYRLPTEAEWEYAASGKKKNIYPWGDKSDVKISKDKVKSKFNFNGVIAAELLAKNPPVKVTYNNKKCVDFGKSELLKNIISLNEKGGVKGWIDHKTHKGFVYTDVFKRLSESGGNTTPVDAYPDGKSEFGCFDMAGNSWDWTSSVIIAQNGAERGESVNAIRGGSWYATSRSCSAIYRGEGRAPKGAYSTVGFRLAADAK